MQHSLLHEKMEAEPRCGWCSGARLKWTGLVVSLVGVALLLVATFLPGYVQSQLDEGIDDYLSLAPDALREQTKGFRTFANWADENSEPVYMEVYMLNLTNPEQLLAEPDAKPAVTQHGPYVYREIRRKFDFEYGTDASNRQTLAFREWTYWLFQRDRTPAHLDPTLNSYTTLNLAFQGVMHAFASLSLAGMKWQEIQKECPGLYDTEFDKMFFTGRTVEQVLFGFQECAMGLVPASGLTPEGFFPGVLGTNLPPSPNATEEFVRERTQKDAIYTGADEPSLARQYLEFRGEQYLKGAIGPVSFDVWGSPAANRVSGTEGSQFARDLKEGSTLNIFVEQMARMAPVRNVDSQKAKVHGIDLLTYRLDPRMLLNQTANPANAAYKMNVTGLLDVSSSKQGLPIFLSKPAFLDAHESVQADVVGLVANRDAHDTTLDVEPLTGATMRSRKRLQVNFHTAPFVVKNILGPSETWYENLGTHFVPLAWIDQHGEISSSKASDFRAKVYAAQDVVFYVRLFGSIVGGLVVASAGLIFFWAIARVEREQMGRSAGLNQF